MYTEIVYALDAMKEQTLKTGIRKKKNLFMRQAMRKRGEPTHVDVLELPQDLLSVLKTYKVI